MDIGHWERNKRSKLVIRFDMIAMLTALIELMGGGYIGQSTPFGLMCLGQMSLLKKVE